MVLTKQTRQLFQKFISTLIVYFSDLNTWLPFDPSLAVTVPLVRANYCQVVTYSPRQGFSPLPLYVSMTARWIPHFCSSGNLFKLFSTETHLADQHIP